MTAILLLSVDADRATWLAARREGIGASDIAALLGISPWDSPFSLWWRKHMGWENAPNEEMSTGAFLEPAIADWYAGQHPELTISPAGLYRHPERAWQLATPDRLVTNRAGMMRPLECKYSGHSWDGWGDNHTSAIPAHYKAQGLWQADVLGADITAMSVLGPGGFREYVIHRDERDLVLMRARAARFVESLATGDVPDLDDHPATFTTVKRLNANIEDRKQEIPGAVAEGWLRSKRFKDLAAQVERRYSTLLRAHLGTAKTATRNGRVFASRTASDQLRRVS